MVSPTSEAGVSNGAGDDGGVSCRVVSNVSGPLLLRIGLQRAKNAPRAPFCTSGDEQVAAGDSGGVMMATSLLLSSSRVMGERMGTEAIASE